MLLLLPHTHRRTDSRSLTPGRRYPGLRGKVVDWVEHKFEEGLLYLHIRFTDKTELCWRIATRMTIEDADLSDWKSGDRALAGALVRQTWGQWEWPLVMSSAERAILELLNEVPQRETFHQADMLMEGLRTLSPKRLQKLLAECHSIKVKRLFLWFAERRNYPWLKQLDRAEIDLGTGKRMLQRGGKLDPKYNITVPENLDAGG